MATQVHRAKRQIPLLQGLQPFEKARIPAEVIAGITLACLAIPEVMGYSSIAGMPVITGLYTLLLPVLAFALLGSSRHLVVGADSASAAIMFAGLAGLATASSPEYVALAGMTAIMVGALLLIARIAKLGFIADFLSRTVLIGFLTGVGIQVACGQFPGLFGLPKTGSKPFDQVYNALKDMGSASWSTFAVAISVILVIVLGGRFAPKIPWALVAVLGAIAASYAFDLSAHGVTDLGTVPSGLPSLSWPSIPSSDFATLIGTAVSIFVVVLAQSAATSRAYAAKFGDPFDENLDLVGLGVASFGAGISGTFVVNGSPTKTAMVDNAKGRTQLSQLTMMVVVAIVLLFLTKPLSYMPNAVLAAVVFLIGIELVDVKGMKLIWHRRRAEFWVALVTAAMVIGWGVEQGIILAIVLSIIIHLRHSYRPVDRLLTEGDDGNWHLAAVANAGNLRPGLLAYHFGANLYYANASHFDQEVRDLVAAATPGVEWICLVADAMDDIDFSGSAVLSTLTDDLEKQGVTLTIGVPTDEVRAELARDGLLQRIGDDHVFESVRDLVVAFEAREKKPAAPDGDEPKDTAKT
jgi:sulfate permease, SulP family